MLRIAGLRSARTINPLVLALGRALLSGCAGLGGASSSSPSSSGVAITPATADVRAGDTLPFIAKVSRTMDQAVVWSVNGTVGGDSTMGKISTSGVYTAPAALPTPNSVSIEATSACPISLSSARVPSRWRIPYRP